MAGLLVEALARPDARAAAAAHPQPEQDATDLAAPGRDDVHGDGLFGEAARIAPDRIAARRR